MRSKTSIIILVSAASLISWNVFVSVKGESGSTISEIVRGFAYDYPIIPFAMGVLVGHWFWSKKDS